MFGWDHKVSATKEELAQIVIGAKRITSALGEGRVHSIEPDELKSEFRRSIVLKQNINSGQLITTDMIDFKRPGTGIGPEFANIIVGSRAKKSLKADYPITWDDLE